ASQGQEVEVAEALEGRDINLDGEIAAGAPRKTFAQAAWLIVVADVSMSLDNVLAVAGAARGAGRDVSIKVDVAAFECFGHFHLLALAGLQFPPHFPANPEQEDTAGKQQTDDLQELGRSCGETDAQHGSCHDADEDGFVA